MAIHIVLVEPEIPQNTGNIVRTCGATNAKLHLVRPLGFSLESKYLKRAGLDYWDLLDIEYHDNIQEVFERYPQGSFYYATTKGGTNYAHITYQGDCFFIFGKETAGLPQELLDKNPERAIRIPMKKETRSLNLSNSVAIIAYEALRQSGFGDMD